MCERSGQRHVAVGELDGSPYANGVQAALHVPLHGGARGVVLRRWRRAPVLFCRRCRIDTRQHRADARLARCSRGRTDPVLRAERVRRSGRHGSYSGQRRRCPIAPLHRALALRDSIRPSRCGMLPGRPSRTTVCPHVAGSNLGGARSIVTRTIVNSPTVA